MLFLYKALIYSHHYMDIDFESHSKYQPWHLNSFLGLMVGTFLCSLPSHHLSITRHPRLPCCYPPDAGSNSAAPRDLDDQRAICINWALNSQVIHAHTHISTHTISIFFRIKCIQVFYSAFELLQSLWILCITQKTEFHYLKLLNREKCIKARRVHR